MHEDKTNSWNASLKYLCIDAVCRSIDRQTSALKYLPVSLKNVLLHVLGRRAALNVTVVTSLLNHSVEKLDLTSCKGLDDQVLRSLASCSQLRELAINKQILSETKEFDSSTLSFVFSRLPLLSVLHLKKCTSMTDDVIASIADNCPAISVLNIGGVHSITDTSMKWLAKLEHLTSLNISHSGVTDDGIKILVQGKCADSLNELLINYCQITETSINTVVFGFKNLRIFSFYGCVFGVSVASQDAINIFMNRDKAAQCAWSVEILLP